MQSKSLKILVASFGSRGDFQPMIGLTIALRKAGHEAIFQGPIISKDLAEKNKVPFLLLSGDPEALLKAPECAEIFQSGDVDRFVTLKEWKESYGVIGFEILEALKDKDLLITVGALTSICFLVKKKSKIPLMIVNLQPFYPTKQFAYSLDDSITDPFSSDLEANLATWDKGLKASLPWLSPVVKFYSKEWDLTVSSGPLGIWEEIFNEKIPYICGFSEFSVGGHPEDWPENVKITGSFDIQSDPDAELSGEIKEFLEKDPEIKPVFLSFGSMSFADPKILMNLCLAMIEKLGKRVILSAGWTKIDDKDVVSNEKLLKIQGAPYDLLFPKCSTVIHHGGAGTIGAGLKAGIPQVVVAFFGDQSFWGYAMNHIGVGPKPLKYFTLVEEELLKNVKYCDDKSVRERAEEIGKKVKVEDGITEVAKIIANLYKPN